MIESNHQLESGSGCGRSSGPHRPLPRLWLAVLCAVAPIAAVAGPPVPRPQLAAGERVEVQLSADFDADRAPDLAYIARSNEHRELRVVLANRLASPQRLPLDPYPLGDGTLAVNRTVLVMEDLTGGTTAVSSLRRFRYDPGLRAMRVIGIDATLYSRTYAHDGVETSWNLLTGQVITRQLRLHRGTAGRDESDAAYDKTAERRTRRLSPALRLEQSPDPDDVLGWPGAE